MPYRVDLPTTGSAAFDVLVELGALDVESWPDGTLAALMPDSVAPDSLARALRTRTLTISPATARDAGSVWVLRPRPFSAGRLRVIPAGERPAPGDLRLLDTHAFGTGLHPTTSLCIGAIDHETRTVPPESMLDVGTGSGILALAALLMGVGRVVAIDVDEGALRAASENAQLNGLHKRIELVRGGPDEVTGSWPLAVANVLAAPLIEMAPSLVRRVGHHGRLILSGIPASVEADVDRAYRRLGMRHAGTVSRDGWVAMTVQASW